MPWGRHQGGTLPGPARGGGTLLGPAGGVPCQGGTQVGYPPSQVRTGGIPCRGYPGQVPPQPGQDGGVPCPGGTLVGYPPGQARMGGYPGRTTEGVLNTRRAVCLFRSRRRTFLFYMVSAFNQKQLMPQYCWNRTSLAANGFQFYLK